MDLLAFASLVSPYFLTFLPNFSAFVTLESFASGGREVLIQNTQNNAWLLDCYAKVPYPFGLTFLEYLDTLFKAYGEERSYDILHKEIKVPGMEFALVEDGYVTETKLDTFERVANNTCQIVGENMLVLFESIMKSPEFHNKTASITFVIDEHYNRISFLLVTRNRTYSLYVYIGTCFDCIAV